jgi:hypothetical protein
VSSFVLFGDGAACITEKVDAQTDARTAGHNLRKKKNTPPPLNLDNLNFITVITVV